MKIPIGFTILKGMGHCFAYWLVIQRKNESWTQSDYGKGFSDGILGEVKQTLREWVPKLKKSQRLQVGRRIRDTIREGFVPKGGAK